MQINYREATRSDNQQLIALAATSDMDGNIGLRIDRGPDFFRLADLRGQSKVFVAEAEAVIIGCISVVRQGVYVRGREETVDYVGDLKVAPSYRNQGVGRALGDFAVEYLLANDTDLVLLTVAKGNDKPFPFFTNRKIGTDMMTIGEFIVFQFIGKKKNKVSTKYLVETSGETEELLTFYNRHYRKYALGSQITAAKLAGTTNFIVRHEGELLAAMCLVDTMPYKRNVVTRVSWRMKLLLGVLNRLNPLFGLSRMPELHQAVKLLYIKYLAMEQDDKDLVTTLINHARNQAYLSSYSFASIGLHEKDPIIRHFAGIPKLTFRSVGLITSAKNSKHLLEAVSRGIPFEDYSLV